MKKWLVLAAVVAALIVASPAEAQGNKFKAYVAFNYVAPTSSSEIDFESIEATQEAGWGLGFEWRFGKWAGLEFDYVRADHDVEADGFKVAETTGSPLSASFNFHLVHTKIIDFYFGPTVSYVTWDDITLIDGETISTDSEWGYGVQVGADFSLFKSVAIVTGLRYLQLDVSAEGESIDVNPLYAKVGVAFRW
jgi:outer membrane protein W